MAKVKAPKWQISASGKIVPLRFAADISDEVLAQAWSENTDARFEELRDNDDPAYRALTNYVLAQLETLLHGHGTILDAGSGLGFLSASIADAGYSVTAVEPSDQAIESARRTFSNLGGLAFVHGTLESYAAGQRSTTEYDVVIANMTLHTVNRLRDFLIAARQLLAPGGAVIATIPNPKAYLQSRTDLDMTGFDLSIEQRFLVPFRIKNHVRHPAPAPYIHRPFREYSLAAEAAGLRIDDYDVPPHIGPGRPSDIALVVFRIR